MFHRPFSVLCLLAIFTMGCGSSTPTLKTRTVKGQVKLDGAPMAAGEIMFAIPNQVPQTIQVKDGAYSGPAHEGKARVEIRSYKAAEPVTMGGQVVNAGSKENFLPAQFNTNSTLTADVTATGANEFTFEVTSK